MPYLELGEVGLYYEVGGGGPALMLIAGLASDVSSWGGIWDLLAGSYRVVAMDHRGVGRTRLVGGRISVEAMADDALALADHLGLDEFAVVGHSMGGFVAMEMARRAGSPVRQLILEGTAASCPGRNDAIFAKWNADLQSGMSLAEWFEGLFGYLFSREFLADKAAVAAAAQLAARYPYPPEPAAFASQVRAITGFDITPALSKITAKTTVIHGGEDQLFSTAEAAALAAAIPGANFIELPEAAHAIHAEHPQVMIRCIREALA